MNEIGHTVSSFSRFIFVVIFLHALSILPANFRHKKILTEGTGL